MSDFGTATYKNRSFAARRAKNWTPLVQNFLSNEDTGKHVYFEPAHGYSFAFE
jgi:hypothetical protein